MHSYDTPVLLEEIKSYDEFQKKLYEISKECSEVTFNYLKEILGRAPTSREHLDMIDKRILIRYEKDGKEYLKFIWNNEDA